EGGLRRKAMPVMYVPVTQVTDGFTELANRVLPLSWGIRVAGPPAQFRTAIEREFVKIDPGLLPMKVKSMKQGLRDSTAQQEFDMLLLTVFAAVALLLAASGIYGLMAYNVQQRTQEIGIRMALGARQGTVTRMILGQGMLLAGIGVAVGIGAAYGL